MVFISFFIPELIEDAGETDVDVACTQSQQAFSFVRSPDLLQDVIDEVQPFDGVEDVDVKENLDEILSDISSADVLRVFDAESDLLDQLTKDFADPTDTTDATSAE